MPCGYIQKHGRGLQKLLVVFLLCFGAKTMLPAAESGDSPASIGFISQSQIPIAGLQRYDPETIEYCAKKALERAVENVQSIPGYFFSVSQVPLLEPIEERYGALWKDLTAQVKAERIEIAGAGFVSFEGAMTCGEAIVRQFLYGKRYFKEKFNRDISTCWQIGAQTHPASLPQILKGCEIDTYYLQHGSSQRLFSWKGIDGSTVLTVRPYEAAGSGDAAKLLESIKEPYAAVLAGPGGFTGGLDKNSIQKFQQRFAPYNGKASFLRAAAFAGKVQKQTQPLPVVSGTLASPRSGIYTTLCKLKEGNRSAENLLLTLEKFAAVSTRYQPYPGEEINKAWGYTLFNQFHGILGGTLIPAAYEDSLELYAQVDRIAKPVLDEALRGLLAHIDTRGFAIPIVVFNPLSWVRDGLVSIPAPDADKVWMLRDIEGRILRTQYITSPQTDRGELLFVAEKLPPFGYRLYSLIPSPQNVSNPCSTQVDSIETPHFKVGFSPATGDITQITAKDFLWEVLTGKGNKIRILEDRGDSNGAMDLTGTVLELGPIMNMEVIEKGPVRVGIRIRNKLLGEHTVFVREIYLVDGLPWIDFKTHIEWNSQKRLVKAAFPVAIGAKESIWNIPYGSVKRTNDGTEHAALKWVDINDGKRGVSLLTMNRYGADVAGNVLRLSLLRSPTWPSHSDEGGNHLAAYALYPHLGDASDGKTWQKGYEYNIPLIAIPARSHSGSLPPQTSFFWSTQNNIMVSSVKPAEDGNGIVLRMVEMEGRKTDTTLRSHWYLRSVFETNLLEKGEKERETDGASVKLTFTPYEIKTIRLKNWGYAPLH